MELRPYQIAARDAVLEQWKTGLRSTLLVLPTGTGKTIVFASIIEQVVRDGGRALILAHRGELLDQAADKLAKATGLGCALEKAESSALDSWFNVVVGSVQTMAKEKRRTGHDFSHIIIDEAHHAISPSYQAIIADFPDAKLLGVTATADRGDKRNLGEVFETLAYEYALPKAIKDGYLVPIKALTIPLEINLDGVKQTAGDFQVSDLGTAIDPYLEQIADRVKTECATRKTVVFLPLICTSQKFLSMLLARGIDAREVNGSSTDRAETLAWFDQSGAGTVLCNAMLLCLDLETEILTDKGFVKHSEMTMRHKVANWSFDGSVFFEEPKEIVKRKLGLDEHMTSIKSRVINIRTTNTHRMIVGCGEKNYKWKKISAQELRAGHVLPASGVAEPFALSVAQPDWPEIKKTDISKTSYYLRKAHGLSDQESKAEALRRKKEHKLLKRKNPHELTEDECRLIGFWMADGSRCKLQSGGMEYILCQSPRYEYIVKWIDDLLERTGFDFVRKERFARKDKAVLWSLSRGTGSGCQKRNGVFAIEPYLDKAGTELFWGLNEPQFDALIEGFWYGDGWHGTTESGMPKSIYMTNTQYSILNLFCAIGSVRGWRCNINEIPQKNHKFAFQWGLRMIKGMPLHVSSKTPIIQEKHTAEDVWCVRTTSKNIITRRNGTVTVMGNTEGWDCPSADCICVLRPTKIRSLYAQMVGRGTRLFPGKEDLLLLDFLWHSERHELCRPSHLVCDNPDLSKRVSEIMAEESQDGAIDLLDAEEKAESSAAEEREESLRKLLEEQRHRKRALVDPLQYEMSIGEQLENYSPDMKDLRALAPPSTAQLAMLEKFGIFPDDVTCQGHASRLIETVQKRRDAGLTTPKQIRFLEGRGFADVGQWEFNDAKRMIDRIAANRWKVPYEINPAGYKPASFDFAAGGGL